MTWSEVAQVPLCLLTPDMQNRRIIERLLRETGIDPHITLESKFDDPPVLACPHGPLGQRDAGAPGRIARPDRCFAVNPDRWTGSIAHHWSGRAGPRANDNTLTAALVAEARRVAPLLSD